MSHEERIRPQENVPPMLRIAWTRGPDLPQGFQDSGAGIVENTLISACGFCNGDSSKAAPDHQDKYPRGFLQKVWGLDLRHSADGWAVLPDFPGAARQGMLCAAAGNALFAWGGFNYTSPFCYRDGYRLSRVRGVWSWAPLPSLPWAAGGGGACALGSRIYLFGGADYDENHFYTVSDRAGNTPRIGARLVAIDMDDVGAGFRELPPCPGTPRWVAAVTAVGRRIFVIGGGTGDVPGVGYCTVVDNWVFDPATSQWSRLRDLPVASGNFPNGAVTFRGRYVVLVGGFQYAKVANPDGTLRDPYGKASKLNGEGAYHNDVFVYDTRTNLFGRADNLPLNNNMPAAVIQGNEIYLIGGETGGAVVEGVPYGQHPDLLLRGRITPVSWPRFRRWITSSWARSSTWGLASPGK